MKKLFIIPLMFLIISCALFDDDSNDSGTVPVITDLILYRWDGYDWIQADVFNTGDYFNFVIYVNDPDLDIQTICITQYLPNNASTPYYGPDCYNLPTQTEINFHYYLEGGIALVNPPGYWRVEFLIEDARGNTSNIYTTYATVN